MVKTTSAFKARTNLGDIINKVYYGGDVMVITRMGKPMVKMTAIREKARTPKTDMGALFGLWKDMDDKTGKKLEEKIKRIKKNSSRKATGL